MTTTHWYVVWYLTGAGSRFTPPTESYALIQAPTSQVAQTKVAQLKGQNAIVQSATGPYSTRNEAVAAAKNQLTKYHKAAQGGTLPNILGDLNPLHWLSSIGGAIASGIEGGVIQVVKDLWDIVIGPLEIILGAIIAMFVLTIYFKDDLFAAGRMIGMAAIAA
jgi:hypothetical protein